MAKTERDIVTKALKAINKVDHSTSSYSADLFSTASDTYKVMHEELQADLRNKHKLRGAYWGYDSVPDNVWINVSLILALKLTAVIPVSSEILPRVERQADMAESALKTILSRDPEKYDRYPAFPINRHSTARFSDGS